MRICSSCKGEVEAATGQCLSCGQGQSGSGPAESDRPVPTNEIGSIRLQTPNKRIYPVAENTVAKVGEALGAAADPGMREGEVPDAEAADVGVPDVEVAAVVMVAAAVAEELESVGAEQAGAKEAQSGDAEEAKGLRATYKARHIRPSQLTGPSKRLVLLAIAQIMLVAVLMALQKVHQPQVNSVVSGAAGGTFTVPLVVFIVMVMSVAAGYWFGLAGALRVRPGVGIPIAALATWTLADVPISSLRLGATTVDPHLSDAGLRWAQLGILAVFWAWLGGTTAAAWYARRKRPVVAPAPGGQPWHPGIFRVTLACVLAYYALEFVIWVLYAQAGLAATGTGSLLADLGVQAVLLPTFLVLVVLLGSTDLLEWGEIAVQSIVVGPKRDRPRWLLAILTLMAALATIANVVRIDGINIVLELAVLGVPAIFLAALVRLAPGYGDWSDDLRSRAVITGATVTFLYVAILPAVTSAIRDAVGWSAQLDYQFYWLVSTPVALSVLTVGLFFLAQRRIGKPEQRGRGLLLVIVGVLITIAGLPAFLSAANLPAVFPQQHFSLLSGLQAVAAVGTLSWLIILAVRGRESSAAQLANLLALLAGLQIIRWILDLLNEISVLGADSDYVLAGLFFLTVFWGFAMSGENLTGDKANSALYPRDGRILLSVGYSLVSTATLLYLGEVRTPAKGVSPPSYLTADPVTPLGLATLGSALVVVAFVARMSPSAHSPAHATPAGQANATSAFPSGSRIRAHSAAQVGIAGVGAVATGAALVILGSALPRLTQANAALVGTPYKAPVPGPGCDTGGALWTVTPGERVTTECGAGGLHVEIGPGRGDEGDVKFLPPNGFTSQNYRISVQITFGSGFDGCAGIYTRGSAAGRYLTAVCGDNSVGIDKQGAHGSSMIYLNYVGRTLTYTIAAVSQGSDQSVYVNGAKIGTVADAAFSTTEYIGLGIVNSGNRAEAAVFSNFKFTPLPAARQTSDGQSLAYRQRGPVPSQIQQGFVLRCQLNSCRRPSRTTLARRRTALTADRATGAPRGGRRGAYEAIRIPPMTTRASETVASSATGGKRRPIAARGAETAWPALTGSPPWS